MVIICSRSKRCKARRDRLLSHFFSFHRSCLCAFPCSMIRSDSSKNNIIMIWRMWLNVTFVSVQIDPRCFSHPLLLAIGLFVYRSSASYWSLNDISSSVHAFAKKYFFVKYNLFNCRKIASFMIALQTSCR